MRRRELDWTPTDDPVDDDYDEPHIPYGHVRCECGTLNPDDWCWCYICGRHLHRCVSCGHRVADERPNGKGAWFCDYCRASGGRGEVDE